MPTTARSTIKGWFQRGLKPLATQFEAWLDSYWHKDDAIPMASITDLNSTLGGLTTLAAVVGKYRDEVTLVNADGTYILNARTMALAFVIEPNADLAAFKIGTTAGGGEILEAMAIPPSSEIPPEPIVNPVFAPAQKTLYFSGIAGTGATVVITIIKNSI